MKKFLLSLTALVACSMGMSAQSTLTVFDGTTTNNRVPLDSYWWDASSPFYTQVIYSADLLEDMQGATITGIKFYVSGNGVQFSGGTFDLQMGTTEQSSYAQTSPQAITTGLTDVLTGQTAPTLGLTEVEFVFDTPFVYTGGNLLYSCHFLSSGTYVSSYFYGANQSSNVSFARNGSTNFAPKTTFTYTPEAVDYKVRVSATELNFGKLNPNTVSEMTVTVKNLGDQSVTPTLSGLSAPFSSTYTAAALAKGETAEIPVKFAPTALGDYTATMTIDCGQAGTFDVALSGKAVDEVELTVCEGTNQNEYVPIYGQYTDTQGTFSQMIYPASMFEGLEGATIFSVKFYPTAAINVGAPTIELSMSETEETLFTRETAIGAPANLITDLTTVGSITLANGDQDLAFELSTPFVYQGGNLVLNTNVTQKGSYNHVYFYGQNVSNDDVNTSSSYCQWGGSGSNKMVQFLPKMTIVYSMPQVEPQTVTVAGQVTDADNNPIEGVNVTLTVTPAEQPAGMKRADGEPVTYTATTDANGEYTMDVTPVEGATYQIAFEKEGYQPVAQELTSLDQPVNVTMVAAEITGISDVKAAQNGQVVYVNPMGQTSNVPFKGVNIILRDGKAIGKVVK